MNLFIQTILVLCLVSIVCLFWVGYCNNKTFKQRTQLINTIFGTSDRVFDVSRTELWSMYKLVSYEQHLIALCFFHNPLKLYHPLLARLYIRWLELPHER